MPKSRRRPAPGLIAALAVTGLAVLFISYLMAPASSRERPREVFVPQGASIARVGRILENKGVIRSATAFRLAARARGRMNVKAGVYTLSPSLSVRQVLDQLENGAPEQMERLTFPEGFTLRQVAERASRLRNIPMDEFLNLASTQGGAQTASFRPPANLEGYLFPDTYDFRPNATTADVMGAMLKTFDEKVVRGLASDLEASAGRGYDLHKVITLASLIEREARVKSEQPRVASVIYNRLKIGMPLQIDATVQYVIGHRERLLYKDLEVDSPYNTYRVTGLPPGPICNPGLDAIRAAMNPEDTDYLYYTARPDGSHVFTRTHEEHVRATRDARAAR